jgi:hypothetical protein
VSTVFREPEWEFTVYIKFFTLDGSSTETGPLDDASFVVEDVGTSDVVAGCCVLVSLDIEEPSVKLRVGNDGEAEVAPPRLEPALIAALVKAIVVPYFDVQNVKSNTSSNR